MGSLLDREVACSTSDRQGSNVESCVWRAAVSDPGIGRRGDADFCKNLCTPQLAIICSRRVRCMLPGKILKYEASNVAFYTIFRPKYVRFFGTLNGGGGGGAGCAVSSYCSHHHQEVILSQISPYMRKGGLKSH